MRAHGSVPGMFAETGLLLPGMQREGKQLRLDVCLLIFIKLHHHSSSYLYTYNEGKSCTE